MKTKIRNHDNSKYPCYTWEALENNLVKRYEPNYAASMGEATDGGWVTYRDYQFLQAKLDAIMFEYCPEEITAEQITEYERHQRLVK